MQTAGAICRNCLAPQPESAPRCGSCGSTRLLKHPELHGLSIAHVDCDAFFAAIEKRDDPSLADKPVIVGGGKRGVVSTACYIARISGVHSAMPMYEALKRCPDAVVIRPDGAKYAKVGKAIKEMMLALTPAVESLSIDEAFIDLSGTERLHHASPATLLARLAAEVEAEHGITVSVGLSFNKYLAKLASDLNKPRGFTVIGRADAVTTLAPLPVGKIWGVGKVFQARLEKDGIRTIGQLQTMDEDDLIRRYGAMGQRLARLSRAEDSRTVHPGVGAKSVSAETTFETNVSDRERLTAILRGLAEKVSAGLKKKGLAGRTVTLKLRSPDFRTVTRSHTLADPTQLADRIWRAGVEMMAKAYFKELRLIGIGVSEMAPVDLADPPDLVDAAGTRRAAAERTMDRIRDRFGPASVDLGLMLGSDYRRRAPREEEEAP